MSFSINGHTEVQRGDRAGPGPPCCHKSAADSRLQLRKTSRRKALFVPEACPPCLSLYVSIQCIFLVLSAGSVDSVQGP